MSVVVINTDDLEKLIESTMEKVVNRKQQKEDQEKLISPEEARAVFSPKISLVTLHAWTNAGRLKKYKIGGRRYYRRSEIIEAAKIFRQYKK